MPRESLLKNAGEETIHNGVIEATTNKKKFENWWYYNKKILLFVLICVAALASILYSIFGGVKPDYNIAIMSKATVDEKSMNILAEQIEKYGEDLNDDGKVVVNFLNYAVADTTNDEQYDVQAQQAAFAKFAADMTTADSMIWFYDEVGLYSMGEIDGLFQNISSTGKNSLNWNEIPGLAETDFSEYKDDIFTAENIGEMFGSMKISVRAKENSSFERKSKKLAYHEASVKLLENLISNTKTEE